MSSTSYPTAGYPYPENRGPVSRQLTETEYAEARMVWRRGLTETLCRSMAADYRMGNRSEDNLDAYLEYQRRFSGADSDARSRRPSKRKGTSRKARD